MMYRKAPLPFQGQKRNWITELTEIAREIKPETTIVDLFGGSGLVSHTIKRARPDLRVIYNDYDHYTDRLNDIPRTNEILEHIKNIPGVCNTPIGKKIPTETGEQIAEYLKTIGNFDYVTIASVITFSGNYPKSREELIKKYNGYWRSHGFVGYSAKDYLNGVETVRADWYDLYSLYKDNPGALFVADPPYMTTDASQYKEGTYWKIDAFLNVLHYVTKHAYIYFTSSKSEILEFAEFMNKHHNAGIFADAEVRQRRVAINRGGLASYTDYMIYNLKKCKDEAAELFTFNTENKRFK